MKKIFLCCVCFTVTFFYQMFNFSFCNAIDKFLDGNLNYPFSYGHANWWEYVDLKSCHFVHNDSYSYEMAVGYISEIEGGGGRNRLYKVMYFRQVKDGYSLPQFNDGEKGWKTIPSWKNKEAVQRSMNPDYGGCWQNYFFTFLPDKYYMFKIAYKKLWGVEYADL